MIGSGTKMNSRTERRSLVALIALFACAYALYGLFRHWHFGSNAYDLGIFDQAIWRLSRFETPASSITGLSNILGDHFYPILALFTPLYWVAPAPETLIIAQAVLLALSMAPVFLFARTRLTGGQALALSAAYALFWGLQRTAAFDVHEMAFAPLLIGLLILGMDQRRWRLFWTFALLLVFVKEDLIPLLSAVGLYLIVAGERRRGAVLLVSTLAAFVLVVQVVIPAFNDAGVVRYSGAYGRLLEQPWRLPAALVTPPEKLRTVFMWLAPFAFLPLGSPLGLLIVPLACERFLSSNSLHWGTSFHYSAPLAPILAMAAADGLARLARRTGPGTRPRLVASFVAASVVLSALLPGHQPLWRLFSPAHYRHTAFHDAAVRALAHVPDGASVVAQAAIVPHLSHRPAIYVLQADAPEADVVIAASTLSVWPAVSEAELRALVDARRQRGYRVVFEERGWIVLHR
jgi:uncharacterized membrane protein